jgi:hypothetical protein
MAKKKKENKKAPLKQANQGVDFTRLGGIMAGGLDDFGGGADSVGYQVKWDKVDFGKSIIEDVMKDNERDIRAKKLRDKEKDTDDTKTPTDTKPKTDDPIRGCTDERYEEHNPDAIVDDGSCSILKEEYRSKNKYLLEETPTEVETPSETDETDEIEGVDETNETNDEVQEEAANRLKGTDDPNAVKDEALKIANDNALQKNKPVSDLTNSYKGKERRTLNEGLNQGNVNSGAGVVADFYAANHENSIALGGGDINRSKNQPLKYKFDRNGTIKGQQNKGYTKSDGSSPWEKDEFNYSWTKDKDGRINFDKEFFESDDYRVVAGYVRRVAGDDTVIRRDGKYTGTQFQKFKNTLTPILQGAIQKRTEFDGAKNSSERRKIWKSMTYAERALLRWHSRGLYGLEDIEKDSPAQYSTPLKQKKSFPQRQRSHLKVRENWMPTTTPMTYSNTPYGDYTPFAQMEEPTTVWEKMQSYGRDVDKKVKRFVKSVNYDPQSQKPIESFQNPKWKNVITQWLQDRKRLIVEAVRNKDAQSQQALSGSVLTLVQDVTTYSGKFLDWLDRNTGENKPGSAGSSVVSLGSKMTFLEASGQLQKDAEGGKPLNKGIVSGYADELLRNEDSILSWAFDPLYGRSWIQDWSEANPDADVSVFMPESEDFDIDRLTDELHGWLSSKLTEAYQMNAPNDQAKQQQAGQAQQIMNQTVASVEQEKQNKEGVYAEAEQPQQDSPMAYAINLIKKYNK